jgi:predicted dehydrogenase
MQPFRLLTLDPGHFHAALIQKEMYPGVSKRVAVYAPLGGDLLEHLNRILRFNLRPVSPTAWELDIHTSPDFLDRMRSEPPGGIVVLSGRNRAKIGYIRTALDAGFHVLADKPWIIRAEDQPALAGALATAESKSLVAYDIMTERYEITTLLQRELVNDPEIFGAILPGSAQEPAVYMESVHHILKLVAGVPNLRPAWFFDVAEQGEALADVGTHLVDMIQWTLFPGVVIDFRADLDLLTASRWPTTLTREQFRQVTGQDGEGLDYYCNTRVSYTIRGVHARLDVLWRWESSTGDIHNAVYRGSKSRIEVRQGQPENYRPELYVVPGDSAVARVLPDRVRLLAQRYPGIGVEDQGAQLRVTIPDALRVGHEAHFAQVTNQFFAYLRHPETFPAWENPNMLAKYYVSTKGVELSRGAQA